MPKRKKTPAESLVLGLDENGEWVLRVKNADGSTRLATEAEHKAEEQRLREKVKAQSAELRQAEKTVISDPDFRPDPANDRYREHLQWSSGATPDYPPTMADLWMRRMEQARRQYQQTYPPAVSAAKQAAPPQPDRYCRYVGPDESDAKAEWERELCKLTARGMSEFQAVSTLVEQQPDLHRRLVDTNVNATAVVLRALAFDTRPIMRLVEAAWALWPKEGELVSNEFHGAIIELQNELQIHAAEWEKTGEPMPRGRREVEQLLGLIGRSDVVAAGNWTPAGIAPMLIGELQRRREQLGEPLSAPPAPPADTVELTAAQAANRIGISSKTMNRWIRGIGGTIEAMPTTGRKYRFRVSELDALARPAKSK